MKSILNLILKEKIYFLSLLGCIACTDPPSSMMNIEEFETPDHSQRHDDEVDLANDLALMDQGIDETDFEAVPDEALDWNDVLQTKVGVLQVRTNGIEIDERVDDRSWVDVDLLTFESEEALSQGVVLWQGQAAIHIRGNSSVGYEKKQYALETRDPQSQDLDVSLFNLPEEEDWVLHAPFSDKTLMRNHLMYRWSRSIGRYAPRTHFVEVYIKPDEGEFTQEDYRGVYVLIEKIKRDQYRVNVEKFKNHPQFMTPQGGYLLKRDWVEGEVITTDIYQDQLTLVYPKTNQATSEQWVLIENDLNQFERALERNDGSYVEHIDIDSFVDHMLMMELSRNVDSYVLSTFMHKKQDGLLTMGPIWDFNGSLGNANYFRSWEPEGWHYQNPEFPADNPNGFKWYEHLLEDPLFTQRLSDRWTAHRLGPWATELLMNEIDQVVALLNRVQVRNFERWPILGEHIWPNDEEAETRDSYLDEIEYLKIWLTARLTWLDEQLLKEQ